MDDSLYMLLAIPFFFLLIGIELLVGWRKKMKLYRFNDAITNIHVGVGNQVIGMFAKFILLGAYIFTYEKLAFFHLDNNVVTFILLLFLYDFTFYWAHRLGHEINLFWGAHVVHHQSEDYNLSVALRQSWFHSLLSFFIFLPIPLLGFDPILFFIVATINTLYQYWIHTRTIGKLPGWFEFFFNTPSHHRVHHGVNPKYIDKNHAGMFIIWDRLFGTFQEEEEEPVYGITKPLNSWNPVWANFHYYQEMLESASRFRNIRDKVRIWFAKPGWQPDYLGGPVKVEEVDRDSYRKYDSKANAPTHAYIFVQFVLVIAGTAAFLYHYDGLSILFKVLSLASLLLSLLICGALLEHRNWVRKAEYARILMVFAGLNSLYYLHYMDWFMITLAVSAIAAVVFSVWFYRIHPGRMSLGKSAVG